jgi:hypothetical protein
MDPATAISLLTAGASIVEKMIPIIRDLKLKGQITAKEQARILAKIESLRTRAAGQFSGPEWAKS